MPIDKHFVDCIMRTIKPFGSLVINVSSLEWPFQKAKIFISENRTRGPLWCVSAKTISGQIIQSTALYVQKMSTTSSDSKF